MLKFVDENLVASNAVWWWRDSKTPLLIATPSSQRLLSFSTYGPGSRGGVEVEGGVDVEAIGVEGWGERGMTHNKRAS